MEFHIKMHKQCNMIKMETATEMKNTERILALKLLEDTVLVEAMRVFLF